MLEEDMKHQLKNMQVQTKELCAIWKEKWTDDFIVENHGINTKVKAEV